MRLVYCLPILAFAIPFAGCGSSESSESPPAMSDAVADLRVDNNRNGVVDLEAADEDQDEETWNNKHGAIFLANLDDDEAKCPKTGTDYDLPNCHDAADEVINGADDLADLSPLAIKPFKDASASAEGSLTVSPSDKIRLFKKQADGTYLVFKPGTDKLSPEDLRAGVEMMLEGTDFVRDKAAWDGFVDITLSVTNGDKSAQDKVRMRVSPIMTSHHLLPAETVYATKISDPSSKVYLADLSTGVTNAKVPGGLVAMSNVPDGDQWTQDLFETGYASMPAADGKQRVMRVVYRSANVWDPKDAKNPLRTGSKVVYVNFRGKDVAVVQQVDINHDLDMDSLNSFGNTEVIPPYSNAGVDYPLGRLFRGSVPSFHPDPFMSTMLESQAQQPFLYIDTSWLLVGHVDEIFSFVKSPVHSRGWVILKNDATLAKKMLEEQVTKGNGDVKLFTGMKWEDDNGKAYAAEASISAVLANTDVMSASSEAAAKVDAQFEILKKEIGIADTDVENSIVHVPFLHWTAYGYSIAYQPGTVNDLYLADDHIAVPDPHGPVIEGKDIFKVQLEEVLKPHGITVEWVENWDLYHRYEGEVHCGSNSMRQVPTVKWWETGR